MGARSRRLFQVVLAATFGNGASKRLEAIAALKAAEREALHGGNHTHDDFAKFKAKYGRTYTDGSKEHDMRKALYMKRAEEVKAHNAKGEMWRKEINHFSDWTEDELRAMRGHKPVFKEIRHAAKSAVGLAHESSFMEGAHVTELCASHNQSCVSDAGLCCTGLVCGASGTCAEALSKESVDWSKDLPSGEEVMNQDACGSCWAVSSTSAIQLQAVINSGKKFKRQLSPMNILTCTEDPLSCGGEGGCKGATAELGMTWASSGNARVELLDDQPYTASSEDGCLLQQVDQAKPAIRIQGMKRLKENDAKVMMQALSTTGPLVASIVGEGLQGYGGGIIDSCDGNWNIDHAVLMMGYGKDAKHGNTAYWKIRNSWGSGWGEQGFFRIKRADKPTDEPCGWDTDPSKGVACKDKPGPDGKYPTKQRVCGTCGILSDTAYPVGAIVPEELYAS